MDWKKRRELLTGMAGAIDMQNEMENFGEFVDVLKNRTPEDAKKQADQRKKTLKKSILETNAALEERQTDIDKYAQAMPLEIANEVIEAEKAVADAKAAIEKAKGGDQSGNIEKLKNLNSDLFNAESEFTKIKNVALQSWKYGLNKIDQINHDMKNEREDLKEHQEEREKLLSEYHDVKSLTTEGMSDVCHECGQTLPEEKKQEMLDNINLYKSEKLEQNMARGKDIKKEIELIQSQIQAKEKELSELQAVEPDPILKQESTPEIDELKKQISKHYGENQEKLYNVPAELTATLEACETRLKQAQETRAAVKASADSVKRLEELKTKKAELSAENDRIEKFLSLHQQYEQALADAIEKPVNDMFQTAYFKMFDTLEKADEDGNFKQVPACIVMDKDRRPFDTALSNGERIQLQLDVARVMQKHFDIYAPIFCDNAEALTPAIEMNCQVIELRHNAELETLTKEV
jgi:DNA repair exonuclease SbcCD ATPase subunit